MRRAIALVSLFLFALFSPAYSAPLERNAFLQRETARVQNHLWHVETALRARKMTHLSPAQRVARQRNLDVLHRYWKRGVFPRNEHFAQRTPYFRDAHRTLCAMAYLIAESGNQRFVEHVVQTKNNAYVRELATSPILCRWLRENGLTVAEAAWIQPTYGPIDSVGDNSTDSTLIGLTALSATLSGTAIATNVVRPPSPMNGIIRGSYGIAAGLFSLAVGATDWDGRNTQTFKSANIALGVASIGYGVYGLATANRRGRHENTRKTSLLPAREFASFVAPTGGSLRATWRF